MASLSVLRHAVSANLRSVTALGTAIVGIVGAQGAIQAVNLMTGLLILRYLDLHAYALYTIAGVLIGVGAVLCNMSLYPATSYFATRVGADQEGLAGTVAAADVIQWWLVVAAAIVLVGLGLSYKHQFSGLRETIVVIGISICHMTLAARMDLARALLSARRQIRPIVLADTVIAALRAAVILPMLLLIPGIGAAPILMANAAAQMAGLCLIKSSRPRGRRSARFDGVRPVLGYMLPLWPEHVFYLIHGNIILMILAWTGTQAIVAEMGALSRLSQIFSVAIPLNVVLIFPFLSRHQTAEDLRKRARFVLICYALAVLPVLATAWLWPAPFLFIIGPQYAHLAVYIFPMIGISVLRLVSNTSYMFCLATGRPGFLSLSVVPILVLQAVYIGLVGVSSLETAIGFALCTVAAELTIYLLLFNWLSRRPLLATSMRASK
jgi:O-antigen/teichoic acid export membrane protein